jgi:hypothetical protein
MSRCPTVDTALTEPTCPHRPANGSPVDSYACTLRRVEAGAQALQVALDQARRSTPGRRRGTLVGLHNTARAIAADLNHALGGWPCPELESSLAADADRISSAVPTTM